jgi:hypothetical protein
MRRLKPGKEINKMQVDYKDDYALIADMEQAIKGDNTANPLFVALANQKPQARAEFEAQLRLKLATAHPKANARNNRPFFAQTRLRMALSSVALMLVMFTGILVTVEPIRTWAQGVMDNTLNALGFARIDQSKVQPVDPNNLPPGFSLVPIAVTPNSLTLPQPPANRTEASQQAGFPVKLPEYLPSGYSGKGFGIPPVFITEGDGKVSGSTTVVWNAANGSKQISLHQSKKGGQLESFVALLNNEQAIEVGVNGVKGVFIVNYKGMLNGNSQNILAWEKDNVLYQIFADSSITQAELSKIAESLK